MSSKLPLKRTLTAVLAALATNVDGSVIIGEAPFNGRITSVKYIPVAAITGQDTNTRRLAVTNRGQSGAGTTEAAFLQFNNAIDAAAFDAKTITLHSTAANRDVVAGDVLTLDSTTPGSGLADPGGTVIVEITRDSGDA